MCVSNLCFVDNRNKLMFVFCMLFRIENHFYSNAFYYVLLFPFVVIPINRVENGYIYIKT